MNLSPTGKRKKVKRKAKKSKKMTRKSMLKSGKKKGKVYKSRPSVSTLLHPRRLAYSCKIFISVSFQTRWLLSNNSSKYHFLHFSEKQFVCIGKYEIYFDLCYIGLWNKLAKWKVNVWIKILHGPPLNMK